MLTASITACLFSVSKLFVKFQHPIAITLDQPASVGSVPFPAVTFLEPFLEDEQFNNLDFVLASEIPHLKPNLFKYLQENDVINPFFTEILMCNTRPFYYEYPFEFSGTAMIEYLRNRSNEQNFRHQKASWNSQYNTVFAKRLTSHGFGYSFNILDADEILNVEE